MYRNLRFVSVVLILLLLCGCRKNSAEIIISDLPSADPLVPSGSSVDADDNSGRTDQLAEGVFVAELIPYTGPFVEDGSNDPCENIAAVRINNESQSSYSFIRFTVLTEEDLYSFTASSVLAGTSTVVLNTDRKPFASPDMVSCEAINVAEYSTAPSVFPDLFRITYLDHIINIKNLSDIPYRNIYVYYKNTDGDGFLGGITYRTHIDLLEGGQTVQNNVENLRQNGSVIVFVTFET